MIRSTPISCRSAHSDRPDEARTDVAVAGEVLGGRERHLGGDLAAEQVLGRGLDAHAALEPVEAPQRAGNPARALLGQHEAQVRMAFEHAAEHQVVHAAMAEDRDLHERPARSSGCSGSKSSGSPVPPCWLIVRSSSSHSAHTGS